MQVFVEFTSHDEADPVFVLPSEVVAVERNRAQGGSLVWLRGGELVHVACGPREAAGKVERALRGFDPTLMAAMASLGVDTSDGSDA